MNREQAVRIAERLDASYPGRMKSASIEIYAEHFLPFDPIVAVEAVDDLCEGCERLPSIAQIRGAYMERKAEIESAAAREAAYRASKDDAEIQKNIKQDFDAWSRRTGSKSVMNFYVERAQGNNPRFTCPSWLFDIMEGKEPVRRMRASDEAQSIGDILKGNA